MAIFICPKCKKSQDAPDPYIGRTAKCLECGTQGEITKRMPKAIATNLPNNQPSSSTPLKPDVHAPPIEPPAVSHILAIVAILELIAAPFAGLGIGLENRFLGWVFFVSTFVSGMILLGFAQVIEYTSETAKRLRRIEQILAKGQSKMIGEQNSE